MAGGDALNWAVAPSVISQLTERLPPELLEKVLMHMSISDILRMKQVWRLYDWHVQVFQADQLENPLVSQVNRYFRDLIQDSPRIVYRVGIFSAGLKDNPSANLSLADKHSILCGYRMKWDALSPIQKSERRVNNFTSYSPQASGSGVFGFIASSDNFIQFLTLESVSRGIPRKEWRVPLPAGLALQHFAICPQADALAMVGWEAR